MTVATGPLSLLVEQLLRHPNYQTISARIRDRVPTHLRDQAEAAATSVRRIMANTPGYTSGTTPASQLPDWLLLGGIDALVAYATDTATTCRHNPHPDRPQPVAAAAWKPRHIACLPCITTLNVTPGSDADRTCDSCGHICSGTPGDLIYPVAVQFFGLIYQAGACTTCRVQPHAA